MLNRVFIVAVLASLGLSDLAKADLVISEIMQNPSAVTDSNGEWFEVFNSGPDIVDMQGFEFLNGAATVDATINVSLIANPGDYLVFGVNADFDTNGGVQVDFQYASSLNLSNTTDTLILRDTSDVILDTVSWDDGATFPDPTGASMVLMGTDPSIDNNLGTNWGVSTASYGAGDLGTPGSGNLISVPEPSAFLYGGLLAGLLACAVKVRRRFG
jgi:hypothetical protein